MEKAKIKCPFVYANGKRCNGHIASVEVYKADVVWNAGPDGNWGLEVGIPESRYHLVCSEEGKHCGDSPPDNEQMKLFYSDLPEEIAEIITASLSSKA